MFTDDSSSLKMNEILRMTECNYACLGFNEFCELSINFSRNCRNESLSKSSLDLFYNEFSNFKIERFWICGEKLFDRGEIIICGEVNKFRRRIILFEKTAEVFK